MNPSMPKLMPPILLDDLTLIYLVNSPEVSAFFVQENCLVHRLWCVFIAGVVLTKLVLVVGAIE